MNQIVHGIDDAAENVVQVSEGDDYIAGDSRGDFLDELEHISSPFTSWLTQIVEEADRIVAANDDGQYDNVMYNEGFAKDFIRLCKLLPLWSGISCDIFGISETTFSSSNVECDFKNLKQALDDIIPCSPDNFVQEHLEFMNGQVLEASQNENYIQFVGDRRLSDLETSNSSNERSPTNHANSTKKTRDSAVKNNKEKNAIENSSDDELSKEYAACLNKQKPSVHLCIECNKFVHLLPGCSISCGDAEGHAERRICKSCAIKQRARAAARNRNVDQTREEMNYEEPWNKSRTKSKSKYLAPAPNWHLNTNIKQKVKLGILMNGNKIKTTHKSKENVAIALRNTCAVDCIFQVSSPNLNVLLNH